MTEDIVIIIGFGFAIAIACFVGGFISATLWREDQRHKKIANINAQVTQIIAEEIQSGGLLYHVEFNSVDAIADTPTNHDHGIFSDYGSESFGDLG